MSGISKSIYAKSWDSLKKLVEKNGYILNGESSTFLEQCLELENEVISEFMEKDSQLDRHKLAGIIATTIITGNFIHPASEISNDEVFIGKYICSLQVGMTLVEEDMNVDLKSANLILPWDKVEFLFPNPSVCKRESIDNDARMLYWQDDMGVKPCMRVMILAHTLFLYEEYTLLMNDIDLAAWKVYKQNEA